MGRITIHLHGSAKEKAYAEMLNIYGNRLKFYNISIISHSSKKSLEKYFAEIDKNATLYLLDETGKQYTSQEFARLVKQWNVNNQDVNLAIGPVDGWQEFKVGASNLISLSKMTFPHELAAVMLVEQVYRATEIIKGTKYHRN
tara:strand:- start:349 stop:777 length:429 start_codon:yes stop_codon:yes gene_type:complete